MVLFVNVLVQRTPVQGAMCPVVESVFKDKEEPDLPSHSQPGGEGYGVCGHLEVFTDRVEAPNLRKLDGEVGKQNVPRALPLQLWCRNTVLKKLLGSSHDLHLCVHTSWSLYLRIEGIASMMTKGMARPK